MLVAIVKLIEYIWHVAMPIIMIHSYKFINDRHVASAQLHEACLLVATS